MDISVVIPTCNRKKRLTALLSYLDNSTHPFSEVIIVDSGEENLLKAEIAGFIHLNIRLIDSEKSVCIQRNLGIRNAASAWVFLCDDDIEPPADYIEKLVVHINRHPEAGAVSGMVLQMENNEWKATWPETSSFQLLWKYVFGLSIWGEINCRSNNRLMRKIKKHFSKKGNHISKAGWPVITDFRGDYFTTPIHGLGASLIKKEWLIQSPYDEVLDRHGIGDNYGVAIGFPGPVHIVTNAFVYHHQEKTNRLIQPLQYFRRSLAMDYFRKNKNPGFKKRNMLWSLAGNALLFMLRTDFKMTAAALKTFSKIAFGKNPYFEASLENKKVIEPK